MAAPLSDLFSESFLATVKMESPTSYMIWDHSKVFLETSQDELMLPPESTKDLLSSLEAILSPWILEKLKTNLELLKKSYLGIGTLLMYSKGTIFDSILDDMMDLAIPERNRGGGKDVASEERMEMALSKEGMEQVVSREECCIVHSLLDNMMHVAPLCSDQPPSKFLKKDGNRRGGGKDTRPQEREEGEEVVVGSLRKSHSNEDEDERDEDRDEEGILSDFRGIQKIYVKLSLYTTADRQGNKSSRKSSIKQRGELFVSNPQGHGLHLPNHPFSSEKGILRFYHGTRVSAKRSFERNGVYPRKLNTEFSPDLTFYITNDIRAAFEFPLFNHPSKDLWDTISIYQFELGECVLYREEPSTNGIPFKVWLFKAGRDDMAWKNETNLYRRCIGGPGHTSMTLSSGLCVSLAMSSQPLHRDRICIKLVFAAKNRGYGLRHPLQKFSSK